MIKRLVFILFLIVTGLKYCYSMQAEKVTVIWCDPLLNIREIHSRSDILNILNKVKRSGIGAIALGIKTVSGEVIYDSKIAPRLLEWDDFRVPIDFDPIKIFLEEAQDRQIQIYAVFSVFSEGHLIQRKGPIYDEHSNWQTQIYVVDEEKPVVMPITDWSFGTAAFVNPLLKEVQDYEISVIKEFLQKYTVDGIILDKCRFSGIESDFSEYTKGLFETSIETGDQIQYWPEDIYAWQFRNEEWEIIPGLFFKDWIEFRSNSMQRFIKRLVDEIKRTDPTLPIGNFVGAWYPTYYEYGVNWASESNIPENNWASRRYYRTATAEMLNYLVVGCFFPRITMDESEKVGAEWWMSIEGSALISMEVVNKVCPVYGSVLVELFNKDSDRFKQALTAVINQTNGLYIYDLSYIERYKYWDEIAEILSGSTANKLKFER